MMYRTRVWWAELRADVGHALAGVVIGCFLAPVLGLVWALYVVGAFR